MKKSVLAITVILLFTGSMFSGCNTSNDKVENARDQVKAAQGNLLEANNELYQARIDSISQFKKESEEKISNNEKYIAEFKAKIANEKEADKAKYEKTLAWLEQQNNNMKKKLADYNDEGQEKWTSFRNEFNHDMDEFGKSFKDLTKNNVE